MSVNGGAFAQWSSDGRELFFPAAQITTKMMVVDVRTTPKLVLSAPRVLFDRRFVAGDGNGQTWTVSRDGRRFLLQRGDSTAGFSRELVVVQNWFDELKRLVPAR